MYYLDVIVNQIANNFVFKASKENTPVQENVAYFLNDDGINQTKEIEVHGVALTRKKGRPVMEVYYDKKENVKKVVEIIQDYSSLVDTEYYPCSAFKSYQTNPGDAIAHINLQGRGTLGGYVLDGASSKILMLSNNHVIALSNNAVVGDTIVDRPGNNHIGKLERFAPLLLPPNINIVDAAVGRIRKEHFPGDYAENRVTPANPKVGMGVYKFGARTGLTYGTIVSVDGAIAANYPGLGTLNFRETLIIRGNDEPFSLPGDSGSFIFNESHKLVGLVFAGDTDGTISFGNSIVNVINTLGIRF
jgi:hypothetical protein